MGLLACFHQRDAVWAVNAWRRVLALVAAVLIAPACVRAVEPTGVPPQAPRARTLTAAEAKDHVGETGTVCDVVASTHHAQRSRGRPTFLNLGAPYPNPLFTVVIWEEARASFPAPPEVAYSGKRVCVSGLIGIYRGVPQIVARTAEAIQAVSR